MEIKVEVEVSEVVEAAVKQDGIGSVLDELEMNEVLDYLHEYDAEFVRDWVVGNIDYVALAQAMNADERMRLHNAIEHVMGEELEEEAA